MRVLALTLAVVMLLTGPALAVAPVNTATVKAAQDYGRGKADAPLAEFLHPWTVYEEKAARLDDSAERAVLYTPFLLIAADARDRTLGGAPVKAEEAEKVLADYKGYIIYGVTLWGERPDFVAKMKASLRQGRKMVKPVLMQPVQPQAEKATGTAAYQAQFYLYFPAREVALDRAATLVVAPGDARQRSFFFPLTGFK